MNQLTHSIKKRLNGRIKIQVLSDNIESLGTYEFYSDRLTHGFYRGDYMINDGTEYISFNYLIENELIMFYDKTEARSYTVNGSGTVHYHVYYTQLTTKALLEVL